MPLIYFGNLTADHRFGNAGRGRESGGQMIKPAYCQIGKSLRFQRIDVKPSSAAVEMPISGRRCRKKRTKVGFLAPPPQTINFPGISGR